MNDHYMTQISNISHIRLKTANSTAASNNNQERTSNAQEFHAYASSIIMLLFEKLGHEQDCMDFSLEKVGSNFIFPPVVFDASYPSYSLPYLHLSYFYN